MGLERNIQLLVGLIPTLGGKRQMLDMSLEKIQGTRGLDQQQHSGSWKILLRLLGQHTPVQENCVFSDPSATRQGQPWCRKKINLKSNSSESPEPALAPCGGAHEGWETWECYRGSHPGHRPGKSSKQQAANLVLWRQGEALKKGKFFAHLPSVRNCTW